MPQFPLHARLFSYADQISGLSAFRINGGHARAQDGGAPEPCVHGRQGVEASAHSVGDDGDVDAGSAQQAEDRDEQQREAGTVGQQQEEEVLPVHQQLRSHALRLRLYLQQQLQTAHRPHSIDFLLPSS